MSRRETDARRGARRSAPDDFTEAVRVYHAASWPVLNDPVVWRREAQRTNAPPLPWPIPLPRTQWERFVCMLAAADVDVVAALLLARGDPLAPDWPLDPNDAKLQVVLRVAHRAMTVGAAAAQAAFGGERLTGKREFLNRANEEVVLSALRLARARGWTRDQAFELLGIPRRQGFRAAKRAARRKK